MVINLKTLIFLITFAMICVLQTYFGYKYKHMYLEEIKRNHDISAQCEEHLDGCANRLEACVERIK